jgi:hypothetical protein
MASKALFAALEFDLFTRIAQGAGSTSALAEVTGIAENRLRTLLTAPKSLGLVSEAGGRLINAPATSRNLVAGAPGDFRDYVRIVNSAFGCESFRHLDMALRGEPVFQDKGFYEGLVYEGGIGGEKFLALIELATCRTRAGSFTRTLRPEAKVNHRERQQPRARVTLPRSCRRGSHAHEILATSAALGLQVLASRAIGSERIGFFRGHFPASGGSSYLRIIFRLPLFVVKSRQLY